MTSRTQVHSRTKSFPLEKIKWVHLLETVHKSYLLRSSAVFQLISPTSPPLPPPPPPPQHRHCPFSLKSTFTSVWHLTMVSCIPLSITWERLVVAWMLSGMKAGLSDIWSRFFIKYVVPAWNTDYIVTVWGRVLGKWVRCSFSARTTFVLQSPANIII